MSEIDEFFSSAPSMDDPLRDDLIDMIVKRYGITPRNLQVELGPSQVGHPCMRKMAFGMMQVPKCNPIFNPLPSIIGTAAHTWMESAVEHANSVLGRERWLSETVVDVTPGLFGHVDLYDKDTATIVDFKFPNASRVKMYKKQMNPAYRGQVHLYGKGFLNAGYPVERVAIVLFPRAGTLGGTYVWQEAYNPRLVTAVLERRDQVIALLNDFNVEDHPERYAWFPTAGPDCVFCDWWSPTPHGALECEGVDVEGRH